MALTLPQSKPTGKTSSARWASFMCRMMKQPAACCRPRWKPPKRHSYRIGGRPILGRSPCAAPTFWSARRISTPYRGFAHRMRWISPLSGFTDKRCCINPKPVSRFKSATRNGSRRPQIVLWSANFGWPILPMAGRVRRLRLCFTLPARKTNRGLWAC